MSLINTVAFFALGFLFRPLGGIFFGRLGDRIGRKKSFVLSILWMTLPTFIIGILPVYSQVGILAPIFLAISRILQTFPSGGELPGAFCYLYENANPKNRKFMSSFAGVGNQIGIALSAAECFLLQKFLPENVFMKYGWRISFIVGGLIGLTGMFLRYKLHETKLFQEMVIHHKTSHKSIWQVIKTNCNTILAGISYGTAQTIAFHFVSIIFPIFYFKTIGLNYYQDLNAIIFLLVLTTIPLPIFGLLGDKIGVKKLAIGSCIGILCLLYPLYYSTQYVSVKYAIWVILLFVLCLTCLTAIWPYLLSNLFPTSQRYTCVGLSFNIADGIIGGLSALIMLYLVSKENPGSLIWVLLFGCIVSLISFLKMNKSQ